MSRRQAIARQTTRNKIPGESRQADEWCALDALDAFRLFTSLAWLSWSFHTCTHVTIVRGCSDECKCPSFRGSSMQCQAWCLSMMANFIFPYLCGAILLHNRSVNTAILETQNFCHSHHAWTSRQATSHPTMCHISSCSKFTAENFSYNTFIIVLANHISGEDPQPIMCCKIKSTIAVSMSRRGIEPRYFAWKANILPLNHLPSDHSPKTYICRHLC